MNAKVIIISARLCLSTVVLFLCHASNANTTPIVFAFDAALTDADRSDAIGIMLEASSQLTDETPFSLIIFDDVIQHVTPLGVMGTEKLALLQQALEQATTMPTSNLAAGLERAQDELLNQSNGNIVILTSAQITTNTNDERAQYVEWYNTVLLPDIAERNINLVFITPASQSESPLLQAALRYQGNHALTTGQVTTSENLLQILKARTENSLALNETQSVPNETATADAADNPEDQNPLNTEGVSDDKIEQTADQQATSNNSGPDAQTSNNPQASDKLDPHGSGGSILQNRDLLLKLWFACFGLVLLALIFWIWWNARRNSRIQSQTQVKERTETGSAYLPLNETPSRHFDEMAESIDSDSMTPHDDDDMKTPTTFQHSGATNQSSKHRVRSRHSVDRSDRSQGRSRDSKPENK